MDLTRCLPPALLCVLLALCAAAHAQPNSGDFSAQALRGLIRDAVAAKAPTVRLPPGTYRLGPDPSGKAHLLLEGLHDLTIDATGVELVMTGGLRTPLVAIYNCSNVTLKGLTVDCDPVTFVQGKIAGMAPDRAWYDLQVDPAYDVDPVAEKVGLRPLSIIDKNTPELSWKHNVPDLYLLKVEWVPGQPRMLRAYTQPHCRGAYSIELGDLAALPFFAAPGFTCRGSVNTTFENCTIYQAGSIAFHEHGGGGSTVLRNCRVMRKPGSGRLLSTNADGFHSKNMRKGPTIENCLFEGMHDDGINIHGMFGAVAGSANDTTAVGIVPCYEDSSQPGDTIEFFSAKTGASLGCRVLTKVVAVSPASPERAQAYHHGGGYGLLFEYQLDAPIALEAGDASMNLNLCGRGFAIRNCDFRALRYRGILLRSLDGIVEGNRIFAVGNDGIVLQADLFSEGPYARNIQIRNNTIEKTGMIPFMASGHGIAVWTNAETIKADTLALRLNRDLVIEGNSITDVTRDGIYLRSASGITLRGNSISGVAQRKVYSSTPPQAVSVADVDDLRQ